MELNNQLIIKARNTKSAEALQALAKAEGIDMTPEEAASCFAQLHKTGELSDDELDNVTGGCGGTPKKEEYHIGDRVSYQLRSATKYGCWDTIKGTVTGLITSGSLEVLVVRVDPGQPQCSGQSKYVDKNRDGVKKLS